jgi:regulator of RNase E activity RraA
MTPQIPSTLQSILVRTSTCIVANAIESFGIRLRNEGYCDSSVKCVFPSMSPIAGHAATLRIRTGNPPMDAVPKPESSDWWNHVQKQPLPGIVVVEDLDDPPGRGAFLGQVHVAILRALGCVGAITNGAVRHLDALEQHQFPLFSSCVGVSHAYAHIVEVGCPVRIGGLTISPGDWLHADVHGVLSVPASLGEELPAAIAAIQHEKERLLSICSAADFTPDLLRDLLDQ